MIEFEILFKVHFSSSASGMEDEPEWINVYA